MKNYTKYVVVVLSWLLTSIFAHSGGYLIGDYTGYAKGYTEGYWDAAYDEQLCEVRFNDSDVHVINGFYSNKGYFCVLTRGRTPDEIAQTTFHELAHYYINNDEEHFCALHNSQNDKRRGL